MSRIVWLASLAAILAGCGRDEVKPAAHVSAATAAPIPAFVEKDGRYVMMVDALPS